MTVMRIFEALGGLGLFLLAMAMMTDGLRSFAGPQIRTILHRSTKTPLRGVLTGAGITALVQSSSAVTIATIGFVNAGTLALFQALAIIFGSNLGTTITGWLVSLSGLDFHIEALALPLIAIGSAAHLLLRSERLAALGKALLGFGLFFLGLGFLKTAFGDLDGQLNLAAFNTGSGQAIIIMLGLGFLLTLVTQSSSAAIALIITATIEGALSLPAAGACVIGANIGTTSTALFASLGATSAAKRVALGHIGFNVATGCIALAILPLLIIFAAQAGNMLGLGENPAIVLALFHSLFNLLGVFILLPFIGPFATFLGRFYQKAEEDLARPRHIDKTLLATPTLALSAVQRELARMRLIATGLAMDALSPAGDRPVQLKEKVRAIQSLGETIACFTTQISKSGLSQAAADEIPTLLRITRYQQETVHQAPKANRLRKTIASLGDEPAREKLRMVLDHAAQCIKAVSADDLPGKDDLEKLEQTFQESYAEAKAELLRAGVRSNIEIEQLDRMLNDLSHTRRMTEQSLKAAIYAQNLHKFDPDGEGEATQQAK